MKTSWMKRQQYLGYLFIGPNMVGVMLFFIVPALYSFYLMFTDYKFMSSDTKFVGLAQYSKNAGRRGLLHFDQKYVVLSVIRSYIDWTGFYRRRSFEPLGVFKKAAPRLIFHALHHQRRRRGLCVDAAVPSE